MENKTKSSSFIEWILVIVVALILSFFIRTFILSSTQVVGSSMNDTLQTNDRLFVNRIFFMVDNLDYGDIVEFHSPVEDKDYIKRVIGLPGDTVEISNQQVYLNGNLLTENYINTDTTSPITNQTSWQLGEEEIFVMGDNRLPLGSRDSRDFGPIEKDSIVGIAFFRYYPLNEMKVMNEGI